MRRLLSELALRYEGRTIAVLGGGESLPEHLSRLPGGALLLSANDHGCMLAACDYVVCMDDIEERLRRTGTPIIGRHWWADFRIQEYERVGNSGVLGAWVAWVLGGHPILLAGMDCYQGGTYHHAPAAKSSGRHISLEKHLEDWSGLRQRLPAAWIRSMGGPTAAVFGEWSPDEPVPQPQADLARRALRRLQPVSVRTQEGARLGGERVPAGVVVPVSESEAQRMWRRRTAVRVEESA